MIKGVPGDDGLPGVNGLSAYEVWLAEGNTGTEQDYLDSLVGPQGPAGGNSNLTSQIFPTSGSGTFTVPPNVTEIEVEMWGAGAGATVRIPPIGNELILCGGGGGAYKRAIITVTPGDVINYNVGGGGTSSGSPQDRVGQPGGNTFFGSIFVNPGQPASVSIATPNLVTLGSGGNTAGLGNIAITGGVGEVKILPFIGPDPFFFEIGTAQGGGAGLGTGNTNHSARTQFTNITGTPGASNIGQGGAALYGHSNATTGQFTFGVGGSALIYITYFA